MNSDTAIRVTGLSKLYHLGEHAARAPYKTLRDSLAGLFRRKQVLNTKTAKNAKPPPPLLPLRPSVQDPPSDELWALKDVNFTINRGEVVGIIVTQRR